MMRLILFALAAADFRVKFDVVTSEAKGPSSFTIVVHEDWAPIGAAQFKKLVEEKFYDNTRFFRVIPTFMVQFGLSGDPATNAEYRTKTIMDEPVKVSNKPGYITFAKTGAPNSRTTQLFINYVDNARLDGMGFAPFGEVEGGPDGEGMKVVKEIYNCGEKPNQGKIQSEGNKYLDSAFPQLSQIMTARILDKPEL
jgi:cyclophilin family peptidyl-prolyl cis-trans isomerase